MAKGTDLKSARQQAAWQADEKGVTVVRYGDGSFGVVQGKTNLPLGRKLEDGSEVYDHHFNGGAGEQEMRATVFEDDGIPSWGRE